jgi:hypothetical protein
MTFEEAGKMEQRVTDLEKEVADLKLKLENRPEKIQITVDNSLKNDKIIFPNLN